MEVCQIRLSLLSLVLVSMKTTHLGLQDALVRDNNNDIIIK